MASSAVSRRAEVLAPAGNPLKLKIAVIYGADAVYLAGPRFGLRYAADNFSMEEIQTACDHAHGHGVKVYVTLNAFLFDEELVDLPAFLDELVVAGVDAVIVSDPGVARTVKRHSELRLHVSTQASCVNSWSARYWRALGAERVVLGRETSILQAQRIRQQAGLEVEMFVHGSMCMAYSGNCTISNYTAGRDSNRGGCSHSCRFSYGLFSEKGEQFGEAQFMSSKDLRALEAIPEMVAAGIDSFKIEGRMKSPLYVASAVQAYRNARDRAYSEEAQGTRECIGLDWLPNRGYTQASLFTPADAQSVAFADIKEEAPGMAGYVLDVDGETHMAIFLSQQLSSGQGLTLLDPQGRSWPVDTSQLRDVSGAVIEKGQPNSVVVVPKTLRASSYMVLRSHHAF